MLMLETLQMLLLEMLQRVRLEMLPMTLLLREDLRRKWASKSASERKTSEPWEEEEEQVEEEDEEHLLPRSQMLHLGQTKLESESIK